MKRICCLETTITETGLLPQSLERLERTVPAKCICADCNWQLLEPAIRSAREEEESLERLLSRRETSKAVTDSWVLIVLCFDTLFALDVDLTYLYTVNPGEMEQIPHYVTNTSSNKVTDSCTTAKARERRLLEKYHHKF